MAHQQRYGRRITPRSWIYSALPAMYVTDGRGGYEAFRWTGNPPAQRNRLVHAFTAPLAGTLTQVFAKGRWVNFEKPVELERGKLYELAKVGDEIVLSEVV